MEIKKIETYSLFEFCQTVEQNIKDGWRFDFNSNELFPTAFGSMLMAGMVKDVQKPKQILVSEDAVQDNTAVDTTESKRGRKPKNTI